MAASAAPPSSRVSAGFLQTLRDTGADVRRVPAVRVVVILGLLGAMVANFVDFSFKAALKEAYDRDQMAAALGGFGVVANTLVLALQILLTGRLVGRLGVGRSLLAGPIVIGTAGLASAALPAVAGTGVARLSEFVVRYGIGNSVADVILVPLARSIRTRAKIVVKGSATPIGGLISAGILAAFGEGGPGRVTQVVLVVGTCMVMAYALREAPRAYAAADVFVLPSKLHETWGLVVNEAMNFALPVIVSHKVGCAADIASIS